MKKIDKKLIFKSLLILGLMLIFTSCGNSITQKDFLKADGKNLKSNYGKGKVVNLRGTNAGGYLFQELWMTATKNTAKIRDETTIYQYLTEKFGKDKMYELIDVYQDAYWSEKDFDNCAELGMNCIRLPFWYRNLVDENNNYYENAFERIDWFIEEAGKRGIYVILDFHGCPGSQNGSDHSGKDGVNKKEEASEFFFGENAPENQALFYKIWEDIAARYEGNPIVAGYDLMNEPYCTYRYNSKLTKNEAELHQILWDIYHEAYNRIRKIDKDHLIIMEATWDPVDLPDPKEYGWENVMYEYHQYTNSDLNNLTGAQIKGMKDKLDKIASANYNVPSFMGEFCFYYNIDAWDEGLALLNESGINWTTWTYKTMYSQGNWGIYNQSLAVTSVNLEKSSFEQIKEAWAMGGDSTMNKSLGPVISKYFKEKTVVAK